MPEVGDTFVSTDAFLQERKIVIRLKEAKVGAHWVDRDPDSKFVYTYEVVGSGKYGAPRVSQINDTGLSKHYRPE